MSEALIFESVNPQYDKRLFIESPEKYKLRTCCVQKLFFCFCFDIQNNICTQHVLNLYFSGESMNNLLPYCGLTDARMRASEKDLPVALENSIMISQRIFRSIAMWCLFLWIFTVIYGAMLIEKLTALAIRLDSKIHGKTCIG